MEQRVNYMLIALQEARKSPPKPTNFCVGACLVDEREGNSSVIESGYTLECEGNTHAEQCCFIKQAEKLGCPEDQIGQRLPKFTVLYTTMEPCNKRSVGNLPCVDRILQLRRVDGTQAIGKVYVGVSEPATFVRINEGRQKLRDAGIEVIHIAGLEEEILRVATAGHPKDDR